MTNRRFEMHEIRQALVRMRMGESNRSIARSGLMGRPKAKALRTLVGPENRSQLILLHIFS